MMDTLISDDEGYGEEIYLEDEEINVSHSGDSDGENKEPKLKKGKKGNGKETKLQRRSKSDALCEYISLTSS